MNDRTDLPAGLSVLVLTCLCWSPASTWAQGACCLSSGCVSAADESACSALGGFYFPSAACDDGPCGVGACCSGPSCVMTSAYSCLQGARDFMGAGVQCSDDPCGITTGACCLDGACELLSSDDCTAGSGTWLGLGTICAGDPCVLGACCVPGDCLDTAQFECQDAEATFFPGASCSVDPCSTPYDCPADSLYSHPRDTPASFASYASESDAGFKRYDSFNGVAGPISSLLWWGLDLEFEGSGFIECVESDNTFSISFHADAGGLPGPAVCSYTLRATRTATGIEYLGAELNEYKVVLPEPCVLVNGWVSIVGEGDPDCWFMWMSAGPGESYCQGCLSPLETDDLSFCLLGSAGGVFGACCDEPTAVCLDGVEITACLDQDQLFAVNQDCDDFDPPCGVITGACCFDDATCAVAEEPDCDALSGNWLGAHTLCDHCPCIVPCPAGGTVEGEPDCYDGYVDVYNGGCDAGLPAFTPIEFCETVCGRSGTFLDELETAADFDWYEIIVESATELTWHVEAEFPVGAWIVDGTAGCAGAYIVTAVGAFECSPISLTAAVEPGVYWLIVAPAEDDDLATCGAPYTVLATQTTPCPDDLMAYTEFFACLTGPDGDLLPGCHHGDFDGDSDVDLDDFAVYQGAIDGP